LEGDRRGRLSSAPLFLYFDYCFALVHDDILERALEYLGSTGLNLVLTLYSADSRFLFSNYEGIGVFAWAGNFGVGNTRQGD